mmetsp:Transcript_6529/g.9602  ORF Transcript_6529/g.9602 Transcript_6529/m.9602 type:complete len:91 (-) Transcript_6529:526-798(-)
MYSIYYKHHRQHLLGVESKSLFFKETHQIFYSLRNEEIAIEGTIDAVWNSSACIHLDEDRGILQKSLQMAPQPLPRRVLFVTLEIASSCC